MYTLFVILIVIAALLMIGIVLIQESKGGGPGSRFLQCQLARRCAPTTNFIEKATWSLAGFMVVISIACAYFAPVASTEGSVIENAAIEKPATNPNNVQGFGASQQKEAAAPAANAPATEAPAAETPAAPASPAK